MKGNWCSTCGNPGPFENNVCITCGHTNRSFITNQKEAYKVFLDYKRERGMPSERKKL